MDANVIATAAVETAKGGAPNIAKLDSIVERLTTLANDKKAITMDEKDVLTEAKAAGFSGKHVKLLVKRLAQEPEERAAEIEQVEAVDMLEHSLRQHRLTTRRQ